MNPLEAARRYLAKLPLAISGAGGHDATFRAACCLVRFGLSDTAAMALLGEWNGTHCRPAWKEKELEHKLKDARRVAGYQVPSLTPKPAVRLVWKIERKPPTPAPFVKPVAMPAPTAEVLPHITLSGDLMIPFDSPSRYHWWRGGQSVAQTKAEVLRTAQSEADGEDKP